jgi:hypothetical protein
LRLRLDVTGASPAQSKKAALRNHPAIELSLAEHSPVP